jgi:hypothetical protein
MRLTTKVLLTACALGTIASGRGVARAGQDPSANQPTPAGQPNPNPRVPDPNQVPPAPPPPVENPPPDTTAPTTAVPDATPPAPAVEPVPVPVPVAEPVPVMTHTGGDTYDDRYSYAWSDDLMRSRIGVSTILGGGVTGFTDSTMRSTTADVGGLWDLRVALGTHIPLGIELGYVGSATNLRGLPAGQDGTLLGTTVEGALRYNMLPHFVATPYLFAGVGWQRYDVTNANVTLSDSGMNDKDTLLEFPMGAGLAYRMDGFVFDLRGTFRAATEQDLVLKQPTISPTSSDFAPMHTWEASAALGYEF